MINKTWTLTNNQPVLTKVLGKKRDEEFTKDEKESFVGIIDRLLETDYGEIKTK